MTSEITHRTLAVNGIQMHLVETGEGPLVVLCHGFPETWHSWRHQLPVLASSGFRAVAPDMRGYGQTDAPADVGSYTILHLVGDLVGLVEAFGEGHALIVGHDWGAVVAWAAALIRPDMFRAVAALSAPFRPRGPAAPLDLWRAAGFERLYHFYFQQPGIAEAEFGRYDVSDCLRRGLYTLSGDAPLTSEWSPMLPPGGGFLDRMTNPVRLPAWLDDGYLDILAAEFQRTGFHGALNWYRNIDRNWALTGAFQGLGVTQPALFIAGTRDISISGPGKAALNELPAVVPGLQQRLLIDGAGHWIQQERPTEVNRALIGFLREFGATSR
jgi:pimeloyl-ACP methyl ester carboxylesterase